MAQQLTNEEEQWLASQGTCLQCNHNGAFHAEGSLMCHVGHCECEQFIAEGDFSRWSAEGIKWRKPELLKEWSENFGRN